MPGGGLDTDAPFGIIAEAARGWAGRPGIEGCRSDGSDGAPIGIVGAAATCLAILLMVIGLVLPQVLARVRRWRAMRLSAAAAVKSAPISKPPDLTLLSVSRT
ncbi:MAG: hypothetical protein ACO4CO_10940 [Candidatus Nanopelagicales bacterium]